MKSSYRSLLVVAILLLAGLIWAGFTPGQAATAHTDGTVTEAIFRGTMPVVKFDVSPPLRDIAPAEPDFHAGIEIIDDFTTGLQGAYGPQDIDPLVQSFVGPNLIPTPIVSFNGPSNLSGVQPPDPNGDVGPNHVVVMSNLSFQIFDKAGNSLFGPVLNNTLWAGFGGDCQTDNSGDPVVLHDQFNDRWILSQFTASGPTYFNCVAISQTSDPTGAYYRYAISTGSNFPDYPKYGVWSNAYYISTREFAGGTSFAGVGAYAIEIADVISGNPTPTILSFLAPPVGGGFNVGDGLLPADLDGNTLPPSDVEYFVGSMDDGGGYGAPQDALTIWEFTPDFVTPANSSFVMANTLPIAAYDTIFNACGGTRNCIPQPGTTNRIDILSYRQRPIWRLAYRNFGSHESLVTNQSVEVTGGIAGTRWWEIRSPGSSPVIYQEGTYAPGTSDGIHRWMGSIAMDGSGNIAFAYSASDATSTFPSVWYTGRLASDPLGTMTLGEGSIFNGTGSQTSGQRWGDYSSLTVDPVDDCTFWAVNEYLANSAGANWVLRIGAFKFDECGSPDFTLSVTPDSQAICTPDDAVFNVNVGQIQGYTDQVTLSALGTPAGTTTNFSTNPVTPPGTSDLTIGNTGAAAAGNYSIDVVGVAATSTHTATVTLDVFTAAPGAPTLTNPADGATDVPFQPTFQWDAVTDAATYFIEVATDAGFTNIVDSATVSTNSYTPAAPLADGTTYYWRVTASNACGDGAVSSTFSFTTVDFAGVCNPTAITIPDSGAGSPYPSNITVAGYGNSLLDVNVQLFGLTHTYPDDLDLILVGPGGQNLLMMSDAGGSDDVSAIDLTLDDAAANPLPDATALATGTYRPANYGTGDTFPAPAPAPSSATTLATFNGTDPNGTWSLYLVDDAGGDLGSLAGGWCLELSATEPSAPSIEVSPGSLSSTQAPDTVITQTLTISNVGDADLNWDLFEDQSGSPLGNWSENFDSYPTGQDLHGVGGWKGWGNSPAATAFTSAAQALSAPNSVDVNGATDLVHEYNVGTSGQWIYITWQYIPTGFSGESYFILLNQYDDGGTTNNWSTQVCFSSTTGQLHDAIGATCTGTSLPIIFDQWVEIRVEIDLDADTQAFYYNNQLLFQNSWSGHVSGGGITAIGAVDLFANTATPVYYDDMSLAPPVPPIAACDAPEDIAWVSASPASGATAPASSDDVSVVLDSTGLADGVYTGTLCITSDDTLNPLVTVPLTLTVDTSPPPTYSVTLSADAAATGLAGDVVSYVVTITNTGSTTDTFDLTATGVWTATLSDTSLTLASGTSVTFTIDVDVPGNAADGDSDVTTVTATSQNDVSATDSADYTTTAESPPPPTYSVTLSADSAATGLAGDVVSYVVTITNTGSTTDTFDLTASGVWTATLSDTSVTLASGASTTFTVGVDVPTDAADGDSDVTAVTATSQNDVSATDSADYTTTAEVLTPPSYDVFLPIIARNE